MSVRMGTLSPNPKGSGYIDQYGNQYDSNGYMTRDVNGRTYTPGTPGIPQGQVPAGSPTSSNPALNLNDPTSGIPNNLPKNPQGQNGYWTNTPTGWKFTPDTGSNLQPQNGSSTSSGANTPANWNDPDWVATHLGTNNPGGGYYTPGYNSKDNGSFERNYNQALSNLTPDQLIQRYTANLGNGAYQTQQDQAGYQAYQSFNSLFGRAPTSSEFSQILPAFLGPNGNINGNAALSNLQQQYKQNPNLNPTSPANNQKPADIQGQVTQQFQSILGRAPTADELAHFTNAIQSNQTDAYGLGNFLKQMPEYTNAQDTQFRNSLNDTLQNYDTTEFNREKGSVMADYAARGFAPGASPSLDYALTDLMGKIANNRSAYLANLSASQYGGNKDLAVGNYQNSLNQMYSQNQNNLQNNYAYGQQLMNQGFQGGNYNYQMNQLMNYMNNQPKPNSPNAFDYLNAGANVAKGVGSLKTAF